MSTGRNAARPRGTDARILLALTRSMLEAINGAASAAGLSRSEWVRQAVARQLAATASAQAMQAPYTARRREVRTP